MLLSAEPEFLGDSSKIKVFPKKWCAGYSWNWQIKILGGNLLKLKLNSGIYQLKAEIVT